MFQYLEYTGSLFIAHIDRLQDRRERNFRHLMIRKALLIQITRVTDGQTELPIAIAYMLSRVKPNIGPLC